MLLAWGRFPVSKAIIPDAQEHFLTPSAHRDTHLFGGLGLRPTFAIRKAYTSAVRSMDTAAFAEQLSSSGRSLESFGDPQLIAIPGGVAVFHDGLVVGAIGVGGLPSGFDDEAIARAGVAALEI